MDYNCRLPLYIQLKMWIMKQIELGTFKSGEKFQRSILFRRFMGLVSRRLGTFVSIPVITRDATIFRTFGEEMEMFGFTHSAQLVSHKMYPCSLSLAQELLIEEGEEVFELVRLFPDLLEKDLDNLYTVLAQRGILPDWSRQVFQEVPASVEEVKLLDVQEGTPLMLWDGIVYGENNMPIEKVKVVYLGSHFRFEVAQSRQKPNIWVHDQE